MYTKNAGVCESIRFGEFVKQERGACYKKEPPTIINSGDLCLLRAGQKM